MGTRGTYRSPLLSITILWTLSQISTVMQTSTARATPQKPTIKDLKEKEIQCPQPQKNPIFKILDKKAAVQKLENSSTPPPKNSKLEYLDNIQATLIYIQTELCERTLEKYINERNNKLKSVANNHIVYADLKTKYFHEAKINLEQVILHP